MGGQGGIYSPRVSVLMAAYNRECLIAETVTSILDQTFGDFELLVVDDGSTDATPDIIADLARQDPRIISVRQTNAGVAAARNVGLARARGKYVAIMDSDDIALPMRLRLQVEYLDRHPGVCGVGSRYFYIDGQGKKIGPRRYVRNPDAEPVALPSKSTDVRRKLLEKGVFHFLHPTATFRTEVLRRVGGYRSIFVVAEDSDLHLRLLTSGYELANLEELLLYYRQSGDNLSTATLAVLMYRLVALAAAHRRLQGLDDLIDGRTTPFDYDFLMTLMEPVGQVVWLEWIGVLQYHKNAEAGMLKTAWQHILGMEPDPETYSETARHWRTYAADWPKAAAGLMTDSAFGERLALHLGEVVHEQALRIDGGGYTVL